MLRPWSLADAGAVAEIYADPGVQRWHVFRVDSLDEAGGLILRWMRAWQAETSAHWAVCAGGSGGRGGADGDGGAGGDGGRVVGRMALRAMDLDEGIAECAYWTSARCRGQDVAPRALEALVLWAFGEAGFHRLFVRHSVANTASCRVALKAGFAAEGTERGAGLHADGWHDMHLHARLNDDPPPEDV